MENEKKLKKSKDEVLFWSIALPGFGQLLNRKYIKGIILILLEFIINVMGNINKVIVLSFHGRIEEAIVEADYLWIMFYPCLYFFAIWDAYRDAGGGKKPFAFLPFVFAAYFVTVGIIYSTHFTIFGQLMGPMWLFIISTPIGLGIGAVIRRSILRIRSDSLSGGG